MRSVKAFTRISGPGRSRTALVARAFILAACFMITHWASPRCQAGEHQAGRGLQAVLDTFLAENEIAPGLSVHVICPPLGLEWSGTAGMAARGESGPITPAHTFRIASNTKTYTAAAILRLIEDGRLRLEDSLSAHLTAAQDSLLRSDGYDTDAMTIAMVLSHTAGLGDHSDDPRFEERIFSQPQYRWTASEKIRYLVEWRDPAGGPGERFSYSDTGYIILGTIIERVTGLSLGQAVRQLLDFEGLGLEVTFWEYTEPAPDKAGPRAHQYYGDVDVTDFHASFDLYGGGGIVTDPRELALFMRALLTGEVFDDEATLGAMMTGGTPPYRLGLMVKDCGGHEAFGHQGFWNTFAYHVPSLDLTIGGSILNHNATNGFELMRRLTEVISDTLDRLQH